MAYKSSNIISGIYSITHTASGRVYIGSAVSIYSRWKFHRNSLRNGKDCSPYLRNAWLKYGEEAFSFDIIERVPDHSKLIEREQFWIDHYDAANRDKGFNIAPVAGSPLGVKHSRETIEKRAAKMRGTKRSPEFGLAVSERMQGNRNGANHSWCGRLTESDVLDIFQSIANGETAESISERLNVHIATVHRIIWRETWASVALPDDLVYKAQRIYKTRRAVSNMRSKPAAKLNRQQVAEIKRHLLNGVTPKTIAQQYNTAVDNIYFIRRGKTWTDVEPA